MPRSVFIIMGSVSGKCFWENQNTFYDQQLFFVQNLVVKMCYCKKIQYSRTGQHTKI